MRISGMTRPFVAAIVLSVSACSTTVRHSQKTADTNIKLTNVAVLWQNNKDLKLQIRKNGSNLFKPTITNEEKIEAEKNLRALYQHLASNAASALSEKLRAEKATVTQLANDAPTRPRGIQTQLRIVPVFAGTECSPPVCSNDMGLQVIASEGPENKQIWVGEFKVGAPLGSTAVDNLSNSFSTNVVSELKKLGLL